MSAPDPSESDGVGFNPDGGTTARAFFGMLWMELGFLMLVISILQGVVIEKETGIKELMKLSGLPNWMHWIAWTVNYVIVFTFTVSILTIMFVGISLEEEITNEKTGQDKMVTIKRKYLWEADPFLVWISLWLYCLATMTFAFFVSTFFSKPVIAYIVGTLVWVVSVFGGFAFNATWETLSFGHKMGMCLIPNSGLVLAFSFFLKRDEFGGMKWGDLFKGDGKDPLCLGYVFVMMIVSTVIYFLLAVYVEAIMPSEFGVRRPLYFPFMPSFWGCGRKKMSSKVGQGPSGEKMDKPGFEAEPKGLEVGVEIQNLTKIFGAHTAVHGVSFKMFESEIFALLGHNGAGKTTLISCCIGMMAPSSGTAVINKFDIVKEMDQVRKQIGICPQHNLLFEELTVDQHLKFFGKLKGGQNSAEAKKERLELLEKLQLTSKKDTMAKKLSGGQKRKLSLGIALIGNAKVVFLDEPTSGMDVEARRAIWNLLLIERQRRTIILTTHFMEEADVLGDRIGIMAHGKVQCCGTSSFLKKFYGAGYTLTMTVSERNQATKEGILSTVRALVPTAALGEETPNIGITRDQIDVTLPTDDCPTSTFSKLFKSLQDKRASLGIKSFGLSLTTMDEVFVKVDEAYSSSTKGGKLELVPIPSKAPALMGFSTEENGHLDGPPDEVGSTPSADNNSSPVVEQNRHSKHKPMSMTISDAEQIEDMPSISEPNSPPVQDVEKNGRKTKGPARGVSLILLQFLGLLLKRFHYTRRKWKLFIAQILLPLFLVWLAVFLANLNIHLPRHDGERIEIGPQSQTHSTELVTYFRDETGDKMKEIIGPSAKLLTESGDFGKLLKAKYKKNPKDFYNKILVAFEIKASGEQIHVYYRDRDNMTLNMAANIKLRLMSTGDKKIIKMTELPPILPITEEDLAEPLVKMPTYFTLTLFSFGILMPLTFAILGASFIVAPIEEKITAGKQLQLMTGVSPAIYWGAAFFWDFTLMALVFVGMVAVFLMAEVKSTYTINGGAGILFLLLVAFAFASLPFTYLASLLFSRVSCGFAAVMGIHFFFGFLGFFSGYSLESNEQAATLAIIFRVVGFLFPSYPFTMGIVKYIIRALRKSRCNFLPSNRQVLLCEDRKDKDWGALQHNGFDRPVTVHVDQCCKDCKGTYRKEPCVEKIGYITWWTEMPLSMKEVPGLGQELMFLLILGVIYSVLLLVLEVWIGPKCANARSKNPPPGSGHVRNRDEDVEEEAQRVIALAKGKKVGEDALVLVNFSRNYGTFAAVKDVNFGLHHGECFGLLGVNGAGKTTTFRMLTGDESRTSGNAYASKCDLKLSRRRFLSKIGYCPQFDGIIGVLTGLEMVALFARLRGVKGVAKESKKWMERVGLTESENVQCQKYSGGMKRRLSAAIALVGDPDILLLDEPTTGVDPVSRREFWKIILSTKAEGRAIILTSHSMDEIAACCTRLAIMVNGELQCLGGIQYLKNRYAQGFSLDLKLTSAPGTGVGAGQEEFASLDREILEKFTPCVLKDSHSATWQYHIHDPTVPWDVLFSKMEEIKTTYSTLIEDYSFSETTLEQVFLAFARMQYPPRTAPGGCCRKKLKKAS